MELSQLVKSIKTKNDFFCNFCRKFKLNSDWSCLVSERKLSCSFNETLFPEKSHRFWLIAMDPCHEWNVHCSCCEIPANALRRYFAGSQDSFLRPFIMGMISDAEKIRSLGDASALMLELFLHGSYFPWTFKRALEKRHQFVKIAIFWEISVDQNFRHLHKAIRKSALSIGYKCL